MAKKNVETGADRQPLFERKHEEAELAKILAQSAWGAEQAKRVLRAQERSGMTITQFAHQHGLIPQRLHNWRRKLGPGLWTEPRSEESARVPDRAPGQTVSVQDVALDLRDPGERFVYHYVQRATFGSEQMWRLLGIGRAEAVLLCAVQWIGLGKNSGPYSLVELELTEPALLWKNYPSADGALQALKQRRQAGVEQNLLRSLIPLLPVQVQGPGESAPALGFRPAETEAQDSCVVICLPSGVQIRMGKQVPPELMRTVLRAVGVGPC